MNIDRRGCPKGYGPPAEPSLEAAALDPMKAAVGGCAANTACGADRQGERAG
jgi:sugar/nucleoside kinase (ribokinase family)